MAADLVADDHFTTDAGRLDWLFKQALARSPSRAERTR